MFANYLKKVIITRKIAAPWGGMTTTTPLIGPYGFATCQTLFTPSPVVSPGFMSLAQV